jgi:hypothetical protein
LSPAVSTLLPRAGQCLRIARRVILRQT